jgi:DNA (cytosine-5)-methyltransferase 1
MKHLDLFSGYGGFTIPAQKYGIETIGFSEIDKYAIQVLNYHYPNIKNYGDITEIKGEDLPTVDIITGGSPCQDLSVAGKGAGLNGKRSGLFFHFMRLIKEKQPTYFVWENVKGALSSSRGWDFARVQIEMEQAGYDVQWQVINAKDFGVPQNRERIFAIGIRKGSGREILFKRIGSSQNIKTRQQVSSTIHAGYYKQGGRDQQYVKKIIDTGHEGTNIFSTDGIAPTQKALGGGQGAKTGLYCVGIIPESIKEKGNYLPRERIFDAKGNARAVSTVGSQHPMYAVDLCTQGPATFTENVRTIKARYNAGITNRMRIRRLTPTECERLMGLKDGWTDIGISDTQRYKLCGNGVVVNCVDYIYSLLS